MNEVAIQRAIRGAMPFSAVVDIDGVFNAKTGGFHVVQDAIDAGHKSIFVRDGTYPPCTISVPDVQLHGESWAAIIDGGITAHAIHLDVSAADYCHISNLTVKTTSGGGQNYEGIHLDSAPTRLLIDRVQVAESDDVGIYSDAAQTWIRGCYIANCDSHGISLAGGRALITNNMLVNNGGWSITLAGGSDDSCITGNILQNGTSGSIQIAAACENVQFSANRLDGAASDSSGTSTEDGSNEVTAF